MRTAPAASAGTADAPSNRTPPTMSASPVRLRHSDPARCPGYGTRVGNVHTARLGAVARSWSTRLNSRTISGDSLVRRVKRSLVAADTAGTSRPRWTIDNETTTRGGARDGLHSPVDAEDGGEALVRRGEAGVAGRARPGGHPPARVRAALPTRTVHPAVGGRRPSD